jgi:hypothetical protein
MQQREYDQCARDRHEDRAETAEPVGEEEEHIESGDELVL